jgi:hypothetical protein
MFLLGALAVITGSLIALSGFIIARKPEAKALFEKITPYQGFLGVGLLVWGVYDLIRSLELWGPMLEFKPILGIGIIGYVCSEILLGFLLGFGLIAKWIPGESGAEKKGLAIQKKLLGLSLPIGVIGLVSGLITLYYYLTLHP